MTTFSEKDPSEKVFVSFDFSKVLTDKSESITSATFSVTVSSGVDADAANILSGSPIYKAKEVQRLVIGGVDGVVYNIICTIDTSRGQRLRASSLLPVASQV
jgi:hypothetical protein